MNETEWTDEDLVLLAGGGGDYGKRREDEEEGKKARQGLRSPHHLPPEVVSRCAIGRPGKLKLFIYRHRPSVNRGSAAEPPRRWIGWGSRGGDMDSRVRLSGTLTL